MFSGHNCMSKSHIKTQNQSQKFELLITAMHTFHILHT